MKRLPMATPVPSEPIQGDEAQTALGLRHCHQQLNHLASEIFATSAQIGAVINVLHAHGLIDEAELAAQREREERRLEVVFQQQRIGVQIEGSYPDKYAIPAEELPQIDCASRYHLCHAACCALRFPLSLQDLDERVARWDYGEPYLIRQAEDQYCVHKDRETHRCTIYAQRPGTCRTYDCRKDSRIWQDFEQRIINPDLFVPGEDGTVRLHWPKVVMRPMAPEEAAESPEAGASGGGVEGSREGDFSHHIAP